MAFNNLIYLIMVNCLVFIYRIMHRDLDCSRSLCIMSFNFHFIKTNACKFQSFLNFFFCIYSYCQKVHVCFCWQLNFFHWCCLISMQFSWYPLHWWQSKELPSNYKNTDSVLTFGFFFQVHWTWMRVLSRIFHRFFFSFQQQLWIFEG